MKSTFKLIYVMISKSHGLISKSQHVEFCLIKKKTRILVLLAYDFGEQALKIANFLFL